MNNNIKGEEAMITTLNNVILPGENVGDYAERWEKTFDMVFLVGWAVSAILLFLVTLKIQPSLLTQYHFFGFCFMKLSVMLLMSLAGGAVCRYYCRTDKKGYIVSSKNSWFKVNYTRKLQHFAAYLVPLIAAGTHPKGILPHIWESLFVLLIFLLLIKPIRENSRFFMLQFNSLDRPEDRPNTLKWIVLGNILPGLILATVFRQLFEQLGEPNLVLIIIFIIGIGDGLAEPVGIYLGKKKYVVPSWSMGKQYVRSYAGSACVFISGIVFTFMFFGEFNHIAQFIAAIILIPPVMTLVEAVAPHSMDTPLMMTVGFSLLYAICLFN